MSAEDEAGPWIEYDGRGGPSLPVGISLIIRRSAHGLYAGQNGSISTNAPNWSWTWRRVRTGWFRWERRRVCLDPRYAPIIAYRIIKPRSTEKGMAILREIVADPPRTLVSA